MNQYFDIQSHALPGQYIREYPAATANSQEETLHIHLKQYTPLNRNGCPEGAVTIIAAHANGFPKELYEPFWEALCRSSEKRGLHIRSVWMADVANQGMSSVLNEDKLGNDPSWNDHARDWLYIVNVLRDKMPRPIVGVGHSMGDPVIEKPSSRPRITANTLLAQMSTFRRDYWPSRKEAAASFRKSEYYQSWDERVLNRWLDIGLRNTPTALYPKTKEDPGAQPVTLLTPKHQEVFTFLRSNFDGMDGDGRMVLDRSSNPDLDLDAGETYPFYRAEPSITFSRLPYLRPPVLYMFAGKSDLSAPALREQRMSTTGVGVGGSGGAAEGRVKQVLFEDAGHLIPMEIVEESAEAAAEWLAPEMQRWAQQEKEFQAKWSQKTLAEKQTLSEEWKRRVGGDPRALLKGKSQL
ncbi:MAG: hypothetical protein LQ349_000914 [Xanthoria aureola]|nr:MAG: hypothetical protein LQ349_000914 [Xanthoria aureola]